MHIKQLINPRFTKTADWIIIELCFYRSIMCFSFIFTARQAYQIGCYGICKMMKDLWRVLLFVLTWSVYICLAFTKQCEKIVTHIYAGFCVLANFLLEWLFEEKKLTLKSETNRQLLPSKLLLLSFFFVMTKMGITVKMWRVLMKKLLLCVLVGCQWLRFLLRNRSFRHNQND